MKKVFTSLLLCCVVLSNLYFDQSLHAAARVIKPRTEQTALATSDLDREINYALEMFHVPGAAVGIIADGKVILSKGYGYRDLDRALPVTDETLFPIASVTKAFTAFMLGQLVDEGKMSWDDPVIQYIPELKLLNQQVNQEATLRDLVAHRTGLGRHDFMWLLSDELSRDEMIEKIGHLDFAAPFRQEFQYNNLTYTLAGIVVERVTGQTWEDAVSSRVFAPLNMNQTNTSIAEMQNSDNYSLPYAEIEGSVKQVPYLSPYSIAPAAGINSNVADVLKWMQLQLSDGQGLIQKNTLDETHHAQIRVPDSNPMDEVDIKGYGLGWFVGKYRGFDYVEHGGSFDGFISQVALLPQRKIGVVILTNSSSDGVFLSTALANVIIDKILGYRDIDWASIAYNNRMEAKHEDRQEIASLGSYIDASSSSLQEYVGDYEHPGYGIIQVRLQGNTLVASYGNTLMPLTSKQADTFEWINTAFLVFGSHEKMDFHFSHDELCIPFEPSVPPIVFKKKKRAYEVVAKYANNGVE